MHGTISHSVCLECSARYPIGEVRSRHASDPEQVPRCDCGSAAEARRRAVRRVPAAGGAAARRGARRGGRLLLCIGSSLEVYPVAQLPEVTLGSGGKLAILTQGPTPFDRVATVRMRGDVVAELDALGDALGPHAASAPLAPAAPPRSARARTRPSRVVLPERPGQRVLRGRRDRFALLAQLDQAVLELRPRRVAGQLGDRGVERDQQLQGGLAVAAVVEVEAGPERELLARQRLARGCRAPRRVAPGGGAPPCAAAAARARAARGRRSRGRRRPASPTPYPTRATSGLVRGPPAARTDRRSRAGTRAAPG